MCALDQGRADRPLRALVVGAGAIGQVFAHHLARGGAEVAFLVKPRHAPAARAGFAVHRRRRDRTESTTVRAEIMTTTAEVAARGWDAVLLCVPSSALVDARWLADLADATGDATVVGFGPGLDDHARIARAFDRGAADIGADVRAADVRTVAGAIGIMAWASPLAGASDDAPAGTAYWVPPLVSCPFTGPAARARAIVRAFRRGGLPAAVHRDAIGVASTGAAVLEATAAALACVGWSRARLRHDHELATLAADAAGEAIAIAAVARGGSPPAIARLLGPRAIAAGLAALARLAPMDLDRFFEAHYSKLAAQSRAGLAALSACAAARGRSARALDALRGRMAEVTRAA